MTINDDVTKFLAYLDLQGIHGSLEVNRGWHHIGAVVVDASLQRRQNYRRTVRPRVENLIASWPDARTTSGFRARLNTGDLASVIRWHAPARLVQIEDLTSVLERQAIETTDDLRARLSSADRAVLRSAFRSVKHVGPKTLDYFDVLVGLPEGVAVDRRLIAIAAAAGLTDHRYGHIAAVIRAAADQRGWRSGDLDAALWSAPTPT